MSVTPLARGSKCTACAYPFFASRRQPTGRKKGGAGFTVLMCHACGHLMVLPPGPFPRPRNMTPAERVALPRHRSAERIKADQQRLVSRLWG